MKTLRSYLTLCRVMVAFFTACSAATGFFLGPHHRLTGVLVPAAAVFLLACGASALNQWQERDIDARMERTRGRPLPAGEFTPARGLTVSLALMLAGLVLLAETGGVRPFLLGLSAVLWYNGVYTALKKRSAFAAVPGAAAGMVPPAIGWAAAGGSLSDPRLAVLCIIFFMWQVPHFWLLLLRRGGEYEKAGLPSLTRVLGPAQISRVTFSWILAASVACLLLPLYGAVRSLPGYLTLVLPALWLVWNGRTLAGLRPAPQLPHGLFTKINVYLLLLMSSLSLENIFFRAQ